MIYSNMTKEQQCELRQQRHAYFTAIAKECSTFDEFVKKHEQWLALMGIELFETKNYLTMRIQLDYCDYEAYHITAVDNGRLAVSSIIECQNEVGANVFMNVFTGAYADEKEIFT